MVLLIQNYGFKCIGEELLALLEDDDRNVRLAGQLIFEGAIQKVFGLSNAEAASNSEYLEFLLGIGYSAFQDEMMRAKALKEIRRRFSLVEFEA